MPKGPEAERAAVARRLNEALERQGRGAATAVARRAEVSQSAVTRWKDRGAPDGWLQVAEVCRELRISADWLLGLAPVDEIAEAARGYDDQVANAIDHLRSALTALEAAPSRRTQAERARALAGEEEEPSTPAAAAGGDR